MTAFVIPGGYNLFEHMGMHSSYEPTRRYWRDRLEYPLDAPVIKIDLRPVSSYVFDARRHQRVLDACSSSLPDNVHRDLAFAAWSVAIDRGLVVC